RPAPARRIRSPETLAGSTGTRSRRTRERGVRPSARGRGRSPRPISANAGPSLASSSSKSPSGSEVDEQRDANQDECDRHDPAGDQGDLDERPRSMLALVGDLLQACRLRPRMTGEPSDLGLDDLPGLELVSRPIVLAHVVALSAAPASRADRNWPARSSAAAPSSRIAW